MQPIDFRNVTWAEIESRLTGLRRKTWEGLIAHGPCTTAELAFETGISILTVRPRVTELVQLGLARLSVSDGGRPTHEGVYEAVGADELTETIRSFRDEMLAATRDEGHGRQMDLKLSA